MPQSVRRWLNTGLLVASASLMVASPGILANQPATPVASPIAGDFAPGAAGLGDTYFPLLGNGGYEVEHYDVSKKIGEDRLFPAIEAMPEPAVISVAGVSCRQQIGHFTGRHSRHIAEVLADRIAPGHRWAARAPEPVPDSVRPAPEMAVHAKQTGNS